MFRTLGNNTRNPSDGPLRVSVLEELLRRGGGVVDLNIIGIAKLIIVGGWYIWWGRRGLSHGEKDLNEFRTNLAIGSQITNYRTVEKKSKMELKKR